MNSHRPVTQHRGVSGQHCHRHRHSARIALPRRGDLHTLKRTKIFAFLSGKRAPPGTHTPSRHSTPLPSRGPASPRPGFHLSAFCPVQSAGRVPVAGPPAGCRVCGASCGCLHGGLAPCPRGWRLIMGMCPSLLLAHQGRTVGPSPAPGPSERLRGRWSTSLGVDTCFRFSWANT